MLETGDVVDDFECRSAEQTEWLRHHARQAHSAGTAKVLVVTPAGSNVVAAYYAWSMASISVEDAPTRVRKGAGRYPQPVALLARLGVSIGHEGRGLGAGFRYPRGCAGRLPLCHCDDSAATRNRENGLQSGNRSNSASAPDAII